MNHAITSLLVNRYSNEIKRTTKQMNLAAMYGRTEEADAYEVQLQEQKEQLDKIQQPYKK